MEKVVLSFDSTFLCSGQSGPGRGLAVDRTGNLRTIRGQKGGVLYICYNFLYFYNIINNNYLLLLLYLSLLLLVVGILEQ